jgi:hypothetical protein
MMLAMILEVGKVKISGVLYNSDMQISEIESE